MQPLITRSDIARYKQIAKTPFDDKLHEQILDAQLLDLQPLIGERFFNKIIANPDAYSSLLSGGVYVLDGIEYTHYGLSMVLTYFAYARYMMFSSVTDTPFSVVEKLNENSRPADATTKKTLYNLNREAAMQVWQNVHNYLTRINHPDYKKACDGTPGRFRLKKIG